MNDLSVEIEVKQIVYLNISSSFLFHHLSAISFSSSFPSFSSLFSSRSYFILFRFSLPLSSPFSTYCSFSPFLYVPLDFFFFFFVHILCLFFRVISSSLSFSSSSPSFPFVPFFINSLPSLHFSPRLNHPPSPLSLSFRVLTPLSSTFIPPFLRCFIFLLNFI